MKKLAKNIPSPYKFEGTPIFRDTTALPFLNGGPLVDKTNHGKLLSSIYASALGDYYKTGGQFPRPYSLPEDSFMQGGNNLHNSVYASSPGQYPAPYNFGGTLHNNLATRQQMYMPLDHITRTGGSILSMSNTPQLEGEGKDLAYKNGGHMYPDGGQFYTYSGRPGATYQKVNGQWYIQTEKTNGQFIPVQDPTGKRTALLNSKATPIAMTTNKYQRTYDPLLDNKPQVGETTKKVAQNTMMAKDAGQYAEQAARGKAVLDSEKTPEQIADASDINAIKNSLTPEEKALAKEYFDSPHYNRYYDPTRPRGKNGSTLDPQSFMERMDQIVWPAFQPFTGNPSWEKTMLQEFEKNKVKTFPTLDDAMKAVYAERVAHNRGQNYVSFTPAEEVQTRAEIQASMPAPGQMASGRAAPVDWLWTAPIAGPAALELLGGLGGLGSVSVPGMSSIPGATMGNAVNSMFIGNSLANTPVNLKSWYDVSQGKKYWKEAALESGEIAAGLIGSGAGAKAALQEVEKIGLKNIMTGKANVKDVLKRNDLINIKTPAELAAYEKAVRKGTLSPTTNRFYSSVLDNSDFGKYIKDHEYVYRHIVPQTAAAAKGKSLANIKAEGAGLIAKQRSVPTLGEVEKLISSGKLSGYSEKTLKDLREVANTPEGYWHLDSFKSNPELQELIRDPKLVNSAEHLLPRPKVEDFELVHVDDITNYNSKLFNAGNIFAAAGTGLRTENALHNALKHSTLESAATLEEDNIEHKLGGTMNFKSNADYHKWLAYGHATGAFEKTPGNQPVSVGGKSHNVQHELGGNMYASGGFANAGFMALPKEVQAKIRANTFADGGPMEAQLTEFSEGGRHEENPLGGIPQGTAPDGKLNLVEQGETKLNSANYIFSDSLKIDKGTAEEFALPKNEVGKTFAEISKKLNRPNSRRENDTIEQVAIKRDLDNLMNAQEAFKQKEVQKKMEEIQALDPNALAGMQQGAPQQMQGAPEMPQNVSQSVQPMGMPEGQPMDPNQIPPEMMAQMPEAQQGQPVMAMGGGMYKCGGKMYNFGGEMNNKFFGGGGLQPSNIDYSQYQNNGLQNPYAQNNGLNGAADNGLNNSTLQDQGFRDYSAGTGAQEQKDPLLSKEQKEGIGGAMGGIGAAIGGGGMAGAPTADKNAQAAQGVKSGIVGAVTAINPIVGGAIALGQGIGTAVRKKTEAVDENGQLINEGKAERGYVAGHFFDPVGAAIEDWSNPNLNTGQKLLSTIGLSALNRKAYSQGLEKNARANLGITGSGQTPLEGESGYNGTFAQSSGNGFRNGGFAHNAGPMGQPLTNLYALGGPTDPEVPSEAGTTALSAVTVTPPKSSAPAIATYKPALGSGYAADYSARVAGYNNNPKDPKTGILMYGAGNADAASATGTGGDYRPYTAAERAARIKMIEGLPAAELRDDFLEEYQVLKNNKPYFVSPTQSDKFIYEPYDLRKYTAPTTEALATMYPPAPDPNALKQNYYTDANTGQVVMDYDSKTGKMVPRAMEGLTTGSRQYSQPLEQMANDPARLAAKAQQAEQRNENVELLKTMTEEQKAAMRAAGQSPRQFLGLDQQLNTTQREMGGYLDSPSEDDMINHLTNLQQSATTHSFLDGGGFNLQRDRLGNIVPYKVDYDAFGDNATLDNPYNKGSIETKMALPVNKVDYASMTEEELAQYLSDLQEADETIKDNNKDLTMNQSLAQGVGQLLPAAYNVGQGLFGKVGTLNPKNFYQKADFQPWEYNINPQLKEVQRSYAQLSKAAQNSGLGGGSYMSNMQQGAMSRNEAMSKLYAEKQNVDAANALDAKVRNKAIEASNKGILANVTDYNIKAKEAKQQMLAAGLKQGADAARSSAEMAAQAAYMKLLAPDFAGTFKYNTIFDQALAKAEAAAKKKKEKEG